MALIFLTSFNKLSNSILSNNLNKFGIYDLLANWNVKQDNILVSIFGMSYKQGVLHLGQARSCSRSRGKSIDYHKKCESTSGPRLSCVSKLIANHKHLKTHDGFLKPQKHQENQTGILSQLPSNNAYLLRTGQSVFSFKATYQKPQNTCQVMHLCSQREAQLMQKNQVLQHRINELHKQSQANILKSTFENKRLMDENSQLRSQISKLELTKIQISQKLQQLTTTIKQNQLTSPNPYIHPPILQSTVSALEKGKQTRAIYNEITMQKTSNVSIQDYMGKQATSTQLQGQGINSIRCNDEEHRKLIEINKKLMDENSNYRQEMEKIIQEYLMLDVKYRGMNQEMSKMRSKIDKQDMQIGNAKQQNQIIQKYKAQLDTFVKQRQNWCRKVEQKNNQIQSMKEAHRLELAKTIKKTKTAQNMSQIMQKMSQLQQQLHQLHQQNSEHGNTSKLVRTVASTNKNIECQTQSWSCHKCVQVSKGVYKLNQFLYYGHIKI